MPTVPNLYGQTVQAAKTSVTTAGLVPGDFGYRGLGSEPHHTVISQSPVAGASVAAGSPVGIVVHDTVSEAQTDIVVWGT